MKIVLTNRTPPISHHIMPLVINAFGGEHTDGHTDTQTHIPRREPKQFQETRHARCAPGLKKTILCDCTTLI